MTPPPKKWSSPLKFFPPFSTKMLLFSKKLLDEKLFETSFSIKKVILIFVARYPPFSSKETWAPETVFCHFLKKYSFFFLKVLNNKIFNTLFVIKKSYGNFWNKTPPFPKKSSNVLPKQFFTIFSENIAFFEKTVK